MRPSQVLELAEAMCCALPPLDAEEQRIAISLYRQLATGRPVPPTATAGASGASLDNNVIARFCHFVHFFPSQAAGEVWVDDHPGTFVLSLRDAFELARISNRRFAAALDDPKLSDAVAWH